MLLRAASRSNCLDAEKRLILTAYSMAGDLPNSGFCDVPPMGITSRYS
jgi:hypothetical protein